MRVVAICLLLLALIFTGNVLYSRSKVEQLSSHAITMLPMAPTQSYQIMQGVFQYSNVSSLGRAQQARQEFYEALTKSVETALKAAPASVESFEAARQSIPVLIDMRARTGIETRPAQVAILKAARDAAPGVQARGTLSAWQRMLGAFEELNAQGQIPPGVFDDFPAWLARQKAVPLRPLGLRDAARSGGQFLRAALNSLGLSVTPEGGPLVVTAPQPLSDQRLIDTERTFNQGLESLDQFAQLFHERALPPELYELRAKLRYNMAAMKLAHVQERGAHTLNAQASNYIADLVISGGTGTVPTTAELMAAFIQGAQGDLEEAQNLFVQAPTLDPALRAAFAALAAATESQLMSEMGQSAPALLSQRFQGWAAQAASPAAAGVLQAIQTSRHVLMLVHQR